MAESRGGATLRVRREVISMTAYAPETRAHRGLPHISPWLIALIGLVAIVMAGIAGYAIAGGFTTESAPGQDVADRVMNAYTTGDSAAIAAAYDPAVKVVLAYDNTEHVVATNTKELADAINGGLAYGNTYRLIGPVSTYEAANGDLYVAHIMEVKGPGHPNGDPVIGFLRVHDGKVIQQIGFDAAHP
jgi:hypothetical protein